MVIEQSQQQSRKPSPQRHVNREKDNALLLQKPKVMAIQLLQNNRKWHQRTLCKQSK
jgi:hypothetical protein